MLAVVVVVVTVVGDFRFFLPASPAGGKSLRSGGAPAPPLCTGLSAGDRINH